MKIAVPEKIVAGKPCEVKITVTNASEEIISSFNPRSSEDDISVFIVNSRGKVMTPTEFGRQTLAKTKFLNGMHPESGALEGRPGIRLEPGQKHTWTIDVAKCFDLKPDTYTAMFSILMLHPGEVVKFEALPPE